MRRRLHDNPTRRHVLKALASLGIGTAVFHRALAQDAANAKKINADMVKQAEWVAGLNLNDEQRKTVVSGLERTMRDLESLRAVKLTNAVAPALAFSPAPWLSVNCEGRGKVEPPATLKVKKPESEDDLAFLPITGLAALLRNKQVTSLELTKLYLERLKKFNPALRCVVNFTEELALQQAAVTPRGDLPVSCRGLLQR